MMGYLVRPADQSGKLRTVIVIHENRGLNAHIKDVARRVALEGFVALAPDYLSPLGGTPDRRGEGARDVQRARSRADGRQRRRHGRLPEGARVGNGKVGAMGFCWGGGTVNNLAVAAPDLAAGVAYYGAQPKDAGADRQDQGGAAAALCRAGRAHQCRHRRLQGGARGCRQGFHHLHLRRRAARLQQRHLGRALQQGSRRPRLGPDHRVLQGEAGLEHFCSPYRGNSLPCFAAFRTDRCALSWNARRRQPGPNCGKARAS